MSARPPPVSGVARGLRLGRAAVEAGAFGLAERLGINRSAEADGARSHRALLAALLELRGAAAKVAQFLSLESDLLPEAVARELAAACHRVPAMSAAFARDMVRSRLGPIEQHFHAFEPRPFAAASLGQVHAATTRCGQPVAVKVQYPGMEQAVRSDLRLLRRATALLDHAAHHRRLLDEVEQRLLEECDYEREADSLAWFQQQLAVDGVTVAGVLPALCAPGVLTMTRLPGLHLDDWLRTGPQPEEKDLAAQRLYDVFVQSMHGLGRLHADPNPGNMLFDGAGRIGLLDFGCTRWIPADYQHIFTRIWRAAVAVDDQAAHAVYRDMGLFAHVSPPTAWELDQSALTPFRNWLALPFRVDRFDFGAQPDFVAEGRRHFLKMIRDQALIGIRSEFILVNRTLYGLYRIFERLQARVRCQTAWTSG